MKIRLLKKYKLFNKVLPIGTEFGQDTESALELIEKGIAKAVKGITKEEIEFKRKRLQEIKDEAALDVEKAQALQDAIDKKKSETSNAKKN